MTTLSDSTPDRFEALCARLAPSGVQAASLRALSHTLDALYNHPPRAYHSLAHIAACLQLLDDHRHLADEPDLVEFALFLHDSVYDPGAPDNESRSADIAESLLVVLRADEAPAATVRRLIMATRHTGEPLVGDEALLADIDTAILGALPPAYDAYAGAIRAEYGFVADPQYRTGRTAFLRALLDRPHIFHAPTFIRRFEQAARANLARELGALGA
ncbi:MAG: hypothetical protein IPJ41_06925 [Phycisphaerales bacterium]|nr:hypothetical protein [Phycisphaerales bacterium]